jgi:thiamine-phosphate pyrophosphorylase
VSPLCAIVDADVAVRFGWTPPALARAYLTGGARFLQLRAKHAPSAIFLQWAEEIAADARAHGDAVFVVNDRADIALIAGVRALHVGQDDIPVEAARRLLGADAVIGLSTHTREQVDAALAQPISYIATGPVFGTRTKDTGYDAVGLARVRETADAAAAAATAAASARTAPVPVVAIGGITLATARSVLAAGATSVAVITDLLATGNPEQRVREYLSGLTE